MFLDIKNTEKPEYSKNIFDLLYVNTNTYARLDFPRALVNTLAPFTSSSSEVDWEGSWCLLERSH